MSAFLYRLGRACFRHRWTTLIAWLVIVALAGGGALVGDKFDDQFAIPGASSQKALDQLKRTFPEASGTKATMLIVAPDGASVDTPEVRRTVEAKLEEMGRIEGVNATISPWSPYVDGQVSDDKSAAMATISMPRTLSEIADVDRGRLDEAAAQLQTQLPSGTRVLMGGEMYSAKLPHITATEGLGLVVALIVLVFTLGSFIAAGLPVITALIGVAVSLALMFACTSLVKISSTAPLLALMLGLAVGIDYALFILSRHRDQLTTGLETEESSAQAVATAGSAVVFAGLTVIIALLGLSVAGIPFLGIMGIFAAIAVAIAVIVAVTLLPALMGFVGERMRPKAPRAGKAPRAPKRSTGGASAWWVRVVTKVPVLTIVLVIAGLGALSLPVKDMQLALPNSGHNAVTEPDRQTFDLISKHFGVGYNGVLVVTATLVQSTDPLGIMADLKSDIEAMPGVEKVLMSSPNQNADTGIVQVVPTTGPDDPRTNELVDRIRENQQGWHDRLGTDTAVTGFTAMALDVSSTLADALLPFGIFVVGLSLILLTMVFRSIWVPVKASLGYLLSIGGAMGATTLAFNKGWGRQLINLAEPEPIISFFPIILMGILFGLAMDYEVFLVSRMREEHIHGADARAAVRDGFVHSAKVVVAAALIMFAVFAFFVPEGDGPIKPIAFGLAVGVAIDAFLVRMTLVPAVMHLLGERAWYLPRWLDRILPSFDIEGEGLRHQLELADWPSPGDTAVVHAEGLAIGGRDLDVRVEPGEVIAVTGEPADRRALLATLAGRRAAPAGTAKIGGRVLATQAGEIRRHSAWLDPDTTVPAATWQRADLVCVDDADTLLRRRPDALAEILAERGQRAVLLSVADADLVGAATRTIDLAAPAATPSGATHA